MEFIAIAYKNTRRGIKASGKISLNGVVVGQFSQEPFAACIPVFFDGDNRETFNELAKASGMSSEKYADHLLSNAEELLISGAK